MSKKVVIPLLYVVLLILVTLPIFFTIYREAAFNTLPRDDYAPFLLNLINKGGQNPGSPYGYRLFSVIAAVPFFYLLPAYTFTNLTNIDPNYLQATEALAMVSYLSIVMIAVLVYLISHNRFGASQLAAVIVAGLAILLTDFISRPGIDPLAVLFICLLVYWAGRPLIFVPLLLLSIGVNEKITILFAALFIGRWGFAAVRKNQARFHGWLQLTASVLAVAIYFGIRQVINLPGFSNQTDISQFGSQFLASLTFIFSAKGAVLNLLPVILIIILMGIAVYANHKTKIAALFFQDSDIIVFFILFLIAAVTDLQFTIGRVVMFAFPLYLPVIAKVIDLYSSTSGAKLNVGA